MRHPMRHPKRLERFLAVLAVSALAFALTGVAFGGVARQAKTTRVTVTFTDQKLAVSASGLQAGTTTFVVVNRGRKRHILTITGPGLKGAQTPKLAAGASATLTVTLRSGAYMLSDPIGLGTYNVHWLQIVPATVVSARGDGSVVAPPVVAPPMCGGSFTP